METSKTRISTQSKRFFHNSIPLRVVGIVLFLACALPTVTMALPSLSISQFPLQLATPIRPQILIEIGNSQSMDAALSGPIMVGSGALGSSLNSLQDSSSPLNYTIPTGFTPPVQTGTGGLAPYTVTQSGLLVDNGPSRLNLAKAGVSAILNAYMQNTDFALATYHTSNISVYSTWVYYMSVTGSNFAFSNTLTAGNRYVTNPCYLYNSASSTVSSNCSSIASFYGASTVANNQYLQIGASSDDPSINDVLYASGQPGVFVSFSGPNPSTPYPPNFTLANYNNGGVYLSYNSTRPNIGSFGTGPTNAGFVPFSNQVFYARRGFGYYSNQTANRGRIIVPLTSAGTTPTTTSIANAINAFTPFLSPETNSTSTTEIKAIAVQSPVAGLLTTAKTFMNSLANSESCIPRRYVLLISDGLPTQDLNNKYWPPLGTAAAAGYGVTATFNADGSLNSTNHQALRDTITALSNLTADSIKTFIIGLGAGVEPTLNPEAAATLKAMAIAGGTTNYYPATNPTALVNILNNILIAVHGESMSASAAAVNSASLQSGTVEYQASYTSKSNPYQDWTGNLREESLNTSTGYPTGTVIWSAQTLLNSQATRLIATWNPTLNSGAGGGAPFQWANISATQQSQLQPSDELGESRLLYLRGNTTLESRNGGTFRNRSHLLGDIVDSQPNYVGPPAGSYVTTSSSYLSFAIANINRQPMIYVGANDGMLHAFNATTGAELFAFVPNGIFSNLFNLTATLYNQSHLFFVDGSPLSGDVQFSDQSWHTILVGGEGAGGKTIYALDITSPTSLNTEAKVASNVLWEFTDTDMGLSYSQPKVAQISSSSSSSFSFAVFFGNGYNSSNNNAILYAVDPQTGQTIRKIDLCAAVTGACSALLPQGLSTVTTGQSNGMQTSPITQVYAGDLQGNLWAVDVSNTNPASWGVRLLFRARDAGGSPQPITTAPLVTLHPNYPRYQGLFILFGTGQLLTSSDLNSTQTQSVYGIWDKPASSTVFTRTNLQSQTLTLVTAATSGLSQNILTSTGNTVNWITSSGWYVDMPIAGQRIITNPQLTNGSFITTLNAPPSTPCGLATAMFLDINYKNGGAFTTPQLDINGSGTINNSDQYNGGNPVGIGLMPGYGSAPTTIGPNANNNLTQLITMSSGQQITIITPNNNSRQTSWWEIQ